MRIILLNGPPGSGKDTIAGMIASQGPKTICIEKFAMPMKVCMPFVYGLTQTDWYQRFDTQEFKNEPADQFFGISPREAQIAFSEQYLKPPHGDDVFGKLLINRLNSLYENVEDFVISDSGFREEAEVVVKHYGADSVELWQIQRSGHTYEGDSRNYINLSDLGIEAKIVENNGSLDDLNQIVLKMLTNSEQEAA